MNILPLSLERSIHKASFSIKSNNYKSYKREGERYVVLHLDWTVKVSRPIRWHGVVGLGNTKLGWEVDFPAI